MKATRFLRAVSGLLAFAVAVYGQAPAVHLDQAEQKLAAEVKTKPTAGAWEKLGLVRHLRNQFTEAIPAFREAVRLDPSRWTSYLFLGIGLYRTNQFGPALESLSAADRLAKGAPPGRDDVDYWLGATHIALGQPLKGLQSLERLLARNPRHVEGLQLAVTTYANLNAASWNEVAEKHFDTPPGLEVHGHALESEGNRKGAAEAFRQARRKDPNRAGPGLALGRLLLLEGNAAEALEILSTELKLPRAEPEAFYFAGLAAVQLGHHRDAATWLERASSWPDRNPEASLVLSQVYLALGEAPKAVAAGRRAVASQPRSPAAHESLVSALKLADLPTELEAENKRWASVQR